MKNKRSGFTLLEVVVAIAILGVGVALALQIFSGGLNNIHRIELAHQAMYHAENVMNDLLADRDLREPAAFSGDINDEFAYSAVVDYWNPPEPTMSLQTPEEKMFLLQVVVDIHFKNDRRGKIYRLTSLKGVSQDSGEPFQDPADAIRRLFGGPSQ